MKACNRKRKIIFVVITFLVIFIIRQFSPEILSAFTVIKDEHDLMYVNYENMYRSINMNKYYKDRERELLNEKYNLNMLTSIKQEEIIKILHGHLSSCNIRVTKFNFSEGLPVQLNNPIDETVVEIDENIYPSIVKICVNIEFNSSYEDMLMFIDELQNNSINMSITNMRTTLSESDIVFVSMDINFYAITEDYTGILRKQE